MQSQSVQVFQTLNTEVDHICLELLAQPPLFYLYFIVAFVFKLLV